jgi:hypothetical protein
MLISKTIPNLAVAVSEATAVTITGPAAESKHIVLENLDASNTLTYKWQYSDDGLVWTDVAAFTTLSPEDWVHTDLSAHLMHRLRAYGNLTVAIKADITIASTTTISFLNL